MIDTYVDTASKNSVVIIETTPDNRSFLLPQTLKERVFGPHYGKFVRKEFAGFSIEGDPLSWISKELLTTFEREDSKPTWLVGFLRGLVRWGRRWTN